ncbi:MAG: hypothetical protein BWX99_00826 [Deltaproteobacteria bacterium ADurb.Bin151]|nr:MAG: hypothetical protein BWX99_00826 [Deltaproteobacteria bacterium ADurb.Bin151]
MSQESQKNKYIPVKILAFSCLVIFLLFTWQGNKGFNLWDEGFLWYGVQRVLLGEVPILDFMAYDPGRYYWSAAILSIVGDNGIMSLRAAIAIFQVLGLFTGLLLIAQSEKSESKDSAIFWVISAATLVMWMFPRHKLFDISLSIMLIGVLTFLIRNPRPKRYIIAGTCVGLIAVFGRNHGMYGAVGSVGVIAWLTIKNHSGPVFLKGIILWGTGVVVGFLPIIFMVLLIPDFAVAFWESIRFLFEQKFTTIPLPVPWPWAVNFTAVSVSDASRGVLAGLFFVGTIVFGCFAVIWVVYRRLKKQPVPPAFVASAFLALPYAHYAFSRADIGHLALGIFPLLVGCLVILSTVQPRIKWPLATALCAASFWVMHVFHPGWQCLASKQCVDVEISGKDLQIDPGTANDIALLRHLTEQYAPNGQTFIAAPFWPGAYALLERKSPMWEIYALFRRSETFEKKEIKRIRESNPGFVLIFDFPLDGRDDLRFKNTHPIIHQYILNNFEPVPNPHNPAYQIYKGRGAD